MSNYNIPKGIDIQYTSEMIYPPYKPDIKLDTEEMYKLIYSEIRAFEGMGNTAGTRAAMVENLRSIVMNDFKLPDIRGFTPDYCMIDESPPEPPQPPPIRYFPPQGDKTDAIFLIGMCAILGLAFAIIVLKLFGII